MNQSTTTCKEKKLYIGNFLKSTILYGILFMIFYLINTYITHYKNNLVDVFNDGKELKCSNLSDTKIVSKKNGYYIDKANSQYITNGDLVFSINSCSRR